MIEHLPVILITVPILSALLILLLGWHDRRFCYPITLATILFQFVGGIALLIEVMRQGTIHYHIGGWAPRSGLSLSSIPSTPHPADHPLNTLRQYMRDGVSRMRRTGEDRLVLRPLPLLVTGLGMTITGDINPTSSWEISSIAAHTRIAFTRRPRACVAALNYLILAEREFCPARHREPYVATGTLNMADIARLSLRHMGLQQFIPRFSSWSLLLHKSHSSRSISFRCLHGSPRPRDRPDLDRDGQGDVYAMFRAVFGLHDGILR